MRPLPRELHPENRAPCPANGGGGGKPKRPTPEEAPCAPWWIWEEGVTGERYDPMGRQRVA